MSVLGRYRPEALTAQDEWFGWATYLGPQGLLRLVAKVVPWLASGALVLCAVGLGIGFFLAPIDARQGEIHRMIFIHVPSTWISVSIFTLMACWVGVGLLCNARIAPMMVEALAPTGAVFAFLALWTGSLWGKPVWGVWWLWDMRLAADLVLMLCYMAIVALRASIEDAALTDRVASALVLVGMVIVPGMLASVVLWPVIDANPSAQLSESAGKVSATLVGIMAVTAGLWMYSSAAVLLRLRCVIRERERQCDWVARRPRGPDDR